MRRGLAATRHANRLKELLEQLGWPGLQDWMVLGEHGDGTLAVRSDPQGDFKITPPRTAMRIAASRTAAPGTPGFIRVDWQSESEGLGGGANLEL